jgi:hypothetical protein
MDEFAAYGQVAPLGVRFQPYSGAQDLEQLDLKANLEHIDRARHADAVRQKEMADIAANISQAREKASSAKYLGKEAMEMVQQEIFGTIDKMMGLYESTPKTERDVSWYTEMFNVKNGLTSNLINNDIKNNELHREIDKAYQEGIYSKNVYDSWYKDFVEKAQNGVDYEKDAIANGKNPRPVTARNNLLTTGTSLINHALQTNIWSPNQYVSIKDKDGNETGRTLSSGAWLDYFNKVLFPAIEGEAYTDMMNTSDAIIKGLAQNFNRDDESTHAEATRAYAFSLFRKPGDDWSDEVRRGKRSGSGGEEGPRLWDKFVLPQLQASKNYDEITGLDTVIPGAGIFADQYSKDNTKLKLLLHVSGTDENGVPYMGDGEPIEVYVNYDGNMAVQLAWDDNQRKTDARNVNIKSAKDKSVNGEIVEGISTLEVQDVPFSMSQEAITSYYRRASKGYIKNPHTGEFTQIEGGKFNNSDVITINGVPYSIATSTSRSAVEIKTEEILEGKQISKATNIYRVGGNVRVNPKSINDYSYDISMYQKSGATGLPKLDAR